MVLQCSYSAIKPDAYKNREEILKRIKNAGFEIVETKEMTLTKELTEKFYAEHKGKTFFTGLIEFMTSGPIFAMILQKEDCILSFREFIGNTDPSKAQGGTSSKCNSCIRFTTIC